MRLYWSLFYSEFSRICSNLFISFRIATVTGGRFGVFSPLQHVGLLHVSARVRLHASKALQLLNRLAVHRVDPEQHTSFPVEPIAYVFTTSVVSSQEEAQRPMTSASSSSSTSSSSTSCR